jgi:hypothetical protein
MAIEGDHLEAVKMLQRRKIAPVLDKKEQRLVSRTTPIIVIRAVADINFPYESARESRRSDARQYGD